MKHQNYKISKRSSSHYPNIKISLSSVNNFNNDINADESQIDLNEGHKKTKRKKVRFLTNELRVKENFKLDKLSPPKTLLKNSILKKSKSKNSKIDSFFSKLSKQHKFSELKTLNNNNNSNFSNNKNSKREVSNTIPVIESNKKYFMPNNNYSFRNISEISKENNNHIFYPILNDSKSKNKFLSIDNNIKNKFQFMNNLKTKKNDAFFSGLNNTDNKYENNKTFTNNLFPTSINEIDNKNKIIKKVGISPINIKEKNKYSKTENNFYLHKNKISKIKLKKKLDKNNNKDIINSNNNYNILISKFKEYQKQIEPSFSLIKNEGNSISNDINNNPFMRKIDNLKNINQFEIIFKNTIMKNTEFTLLL